METILGKDKNSVEKSTWNDSYKIFIPVIDEQHKQFFDIYDDLVKSSNSTVSEETQVFISRLSSYIKDHFVEEEFLMKNSNFKGYEEHVRQHKFFEKKIEELQLAYTYKNPSLLSQLLLFIRKWFLSHISKSDPGYKETVMQYLSKE